MKLIGVLLFCAAALSVRSEEANKEQLLAVANDCKTEAGATDEDVAAMFKHEAASSTEAKCMRSCVMKKFEIMNDEGKMVKEAAINVFKAMAKEDAEKEAVVEEIVEACAHLEAPEDHCEAAEVYSSCLFTTAHEKGLKFDA